MHLYHKFIRVMGQETDFRWYLVIGWLGPLLFVLPSVFAFREHYGTDDMCFLDTSSNANYMLTVPIGLCLFANSVVMIYILRNIGKHVEGSVAVAKAQVKGVIAFGATLGLVYIFGAMNIIWKGNKVFPVIFALGVGIQGALIFYFHVYEKDAFKKRIHDRISGKGGQKSKLNLRSSKSKRGSKSRSSTSRSSSSERGRGASNSVEGNSMVIMENVTEETEETPKNDDTRKTYREQRKHKNAENG